MYGAPFYGGIVPYAYPAPAAAGVPGSEGTAKADKPVANQTMAAANGSSALGSAALPPRVSRSHEDDPDLVGSWRGMYPRLILCSKAYFCFQGAQVAQAQRISLHSKASSTSLNGLSESGQYAKQSQVCTPPASPIQTPAAEPSKEKTLHASDTEGIKAEGQAAAMAAIAAAQAQVNGHARDESRANSGEYWVRSNSEEDMERVDSGGLQVLHMK